MELKILGSVAPYCKEGKNCPGYLIKTENEKILLDCGNGITNYLDMENDLANLTIFISHYHPDHYSDLSSIAEAIDLFHRFGIIEKKVKLYLPKLYHEKYQINEKTNEKYVKQLASNHFFDIYEYHENSHILLGNTRISFYQTLHPTDTYAVKIKNQEGYIVYSADTDYDLGLVDFYQNADILLCEASLLRNQEKKCQHLYAYEAAKLAKKSKVKQLILTHFWPEIDRENYVNEAKEYFKNTVAAKEGKIFQLTKENVLK